MWWLCWKTQAHGVKLREVDLCPPFLHRFSQFPFILFVLRLLSVTLGGFVPPGVNQLPNKQLLDQSRPGIFGVAAVGGDAVGLKHGAAAQRVDLRRQTHPTSEQFMKSPDQDSAQPEHKEKPSPPSAGGGLLQAPHTAP